MENNNVEEHLSEKGKFLYENVTELSQGKSIYITIHENNNGSEKYHVEISFYDPTKENLEKNVLKMNEGDKVPSAEEIIIDNDLIESNLFDGLSVKYNWSEDKFDIEKGTELKGKEAYNFLEDLKERDRIKSHENELKGSEIVYDKTSIEISYVSANVMYAIADMRINLGERELQSSDSLSDSLKTKLLELPEMLEEIADKDLYTYNKSREYHGEPSVTKEELLNISTEKRITIEKMYNEIKRDEGVLKHLEEQKKLDIVKSEAKETVEKINYTGKNKFKEEREKFVDSVIKSLEEGKIPWEKDWNLNQNGAIHNPVSKTNYRGINNAKLLITGMKKGYTDSRWLTYNQANSQGWHVKKGEKGTSIEIFKYYDKKTKKDLDFNMYNSLSKEEKEKYFKENVYIVAKTYTVFNGEQIEGIPKLEKKEVDIQKEYNKIDKIIKNCGVPIEYGGNNACYIPNLDKIKLPEKAQFKSEDRFYGTALHEIAHSTGHSSRLNRDLTGKFGSEKYAKEELVAEFASVFIAQEKGICCTNREENSKAYIQSWIKALKNDKNELFVAMKEAEKASQMVLGYEKEQKLEKNNENVKGKNVEIER